jgi:hypothetical protein
MKKTTQAYYIVLLSLVSNLVLAQDPSREIVNINKSFYGNNDLAVEVTTRCFIDNAENPNKESTTDIYKTPGSYLYKTTSSESMANKHYKINIDHQKKVMVVGEVTSSAPQNKKSDVELLEKQNFKMTLDTILGYYKKVTVKSANASTNEITFSFKSGMYDYITISYDKASYKVYSYYIKLNGAAINAKDGRQHSYVYTITNKYFNKGSLSNKLFSENNYIEVKEQEIIPIGRYSAYRLVNNIKKQS